MTTNETPQIPVPRSGKFHRILTKTLYTWEPFCGIMGRVDSDRIQNSQVLPTQRPNASIG